MLLFRSQLPYRANNALCHTTSNKNIINGMWMCYLALEILTAVFISYMCFILYYACSYTIDDNLTVKQCDSASQLAPHLI
jgi:hypothetical protein